MKNAPEGWQWVRIQDRACPQCGQDPAADVCSPIQYGAHVRDMVRVFGDRILLACFAVHEAHHHLLDAQGRIRPAH